jgi:hypothetical protein
VRLDSPELLIVAQLVGSGHAEGAKRSQLALLLDRSHGVGESVLFSVALGLHSHCLLFLRVLLVPLGRLSLALRDGLQDSGGIAGEGRDVVRVCVRTIVLVECGQFSEDELVCAGLGRCTCRRISCAGRSTVP